METLTLTVENGSFSYPKSGAKTLDGVNFSAGSGDIVAILGPNGAGKTTLLRCTMGFLKWDEGRSTLGERDIASLPPRELWSELAYVPQARAASGAYTVEDTVMLGRGSRFGFFEQPGKRDIEIVRASLERLHIARLAKKRCSEISGGELQMALIARALASEPKALVLDEPESNLDFKNQLLVLETIASLAAEGRTIIFNTHYPAHALRLANKSLLFREGKTVFGPTRGIVTEENISRAFGVRAVIGEFETDTRVLRDVVPVEVTREVGAAEPEGGSRIAVIAVVASDYGAGEKINALLHEYSEYLVGRMGLPYKKRGLHIINVTLDAPDSVTNTLTDAFARIPGVSVKATFEGR